MRIGRWVGAQTHRPFFLPLPLDSIDLESSDLLGAPSQHLAAIWQIDEVLRSQGRGLMATTLEQGRSLAASLFGKYDPDLQSPGQVADLELPPFFSFGETVFDRAHDVEIGDVAGALGLPQRDQDVIAVAFLVAVNYHTGRATIVGKYLPLTPGIIGKTDDFVLKKLDPLLLLEDSGFALGVDKFQRCVIVQYFIHTLPALPVYPPS